MTPIARILGPVPTLDDVARARLERAVLDELARPEPARPRSLRWPIAAGAALAVAAAALIVLALRGGGATTPAPTRFAATDATAELWWAHAHLVIEPGGAIVTDGDAEHGATATIERGAVRFEVEPRGTRPPFRVVAGEVRVEVVGTRFRVARSGDAVEVEVDEGTVRVTEGGETTAVTAGERWPAIAAAPAPVPVPVPAPVPVPVPAPVADEPVAPPPPPRKHPRLSDPSAEFEEAARLEASDRTGAIARYRKLTARSDRWGAISLYAIGRLEAEHGDRAAARKDLASYLRRFPDGANAEDARAVLRHLAP